MKLNESLYFTNNVTLCLFDINSSKLKTFKEGNKFKIEKIESNYNSYYKTFIYHIRAYEKFSNSCCIFMCSKKEDSKKVTVYNGEDKDIYLDWNSIFKEKCPID